MTMTVITVQIKFEHSPRPVKKAFAKQTKTQLQFSIGLHMDADSERIWTMSLYYSLKS